MITGMSRIHYGDNGQVIGPRTYAKRYIRNRIRDGIYQPGSKIPSIPTLAESWDMSEGTVRAAIKELTAEGYVKAVQGVGVIVLAPEFWTESDHVK